MRLIALILLAATAQAQRSETVEGDFTLRNTVADPRGITWTAAYTKANQALAQLNQNEKLGIVTGVGWSKGPCVGNTSPAPKIGYPDLCLQDGPLGVRHAHDVTVFPAGVHAASTWDTGLMYKRGYALGTEAKGLGVHVQLGPVAGPLGKIPHGGRNWEGFSPDPFLTGIAMQETIRGMQEAGVQANAKHFIGNEQEYERTTISSNIDDRTLHELYLWPFADAIQANVASVMCSYNKLNTTWACENDKILNGILKGELGFKGYVMSDWNAQHTTAKSAKAGLDMSMPGTGFDGKGVLFGSVLSKAIPSQVPQARLDDMVRRILAAWYYLGQDSTSYPRVKFNSWKGGRGGPDVQADHKKVARSVARDGIVLLKNKDGILPLKKPESLAIIGLDAMADPAGPNSCVDKGCNNATIGMGWGSGTAEYPYLSAPADAIEARAKKDGTAVFISGTNNAVNGMETAAAADIAIVFINALSGEEYIKVEGQPADRVNLDPWHEGNELVSFTATAKKPVIVVVHSVGPIILEKILAQPNVVAVVWAGLPGQESGNALVDVLYGDVSPNGKLPYTIAKREQDYRTAIKKGGVDTFDERVYIDYRQFDKNNVEPRYEFGYGLSYTTFEYSDLAVTPAAVNSDKTNGPVTVQRQSSLYEHTGHQISLKITNTGKVDGAEIAQLYLSFPQLPGVDFPPWQLRGFDKVFIKAGESKRVTFTLRQKDVSYWNVKAQKWTAVPGDISVRVAPSSRAKGVMKTLRA